MRDFLGFLVVLAIVFFAVGEWRGWYLGVPGQTPMFVYKKDYAAEATRRTINRDDFPLSLNGQVRNGTVTVEAYYEDAGSFQDGISGAGKEEEIETWEFRQGQRININELLEEGKGFYRVRIVFDDATGLFRMNLPTAAEL